MLIQMRRLVGGAVAVACLFTTFITLAAPAARAQQELIEADPDVVRARAEVEAAQLAAHQAANQLEQATQQRDATQASIDEHVAHLAELDAQRADLAAQRDVLKADLRAACGLPVPRRWQHQRARSAEGRQRGAGRPPRPAR